MLYKPPSKTVVIWYSI